MSNKTMKQRIAVVAVSALTAGVLSVASTPVANAAVETSMNLFQNTAAGGVYSLNGTSSTSQGLIGTIATATNGTGLAQAVAMYSNGVIVVATTQTANALKISVTGGTLAVPCTKAGSGTLASSADLTSCTATADASGHLFAAIKPSSTGTMVITGIDGTAATVATFRITVTVVAAGSAGTFSASKSNIALTAAGSAPTAANIDTAGVSTVANGTCAYLYYAANDALSLPLAGSSIIAKSSNSAGAVTIGGTTGTLPVVTGTYSSATYIALCQNAANANKAVTSTITLTVDGVDVATRTVTIVGQLATITVSEDAVSVRGDAGTDDAIYGANATQSTGTWSPSHSYTGKDAAGNLVAFTAALDTTTIDAQVTGLGEVGAAAPLNANPYLRTGALTFACADTSGANTKLKVKASAADTTTIYSNAFTVTCAGNAVNYKASTDKAAYNTGDVMTVTVTGTDASGKAANNYGVISTTAKLGTIASGAISSSVNAPANLDTLTKGAKTYKYIIGQTTGTYTIAVDFPNVNNTTYGQTALTLPVSVKSATTEVSNADVLKSIVALIASINKQIQALQKLILARR